MSKRRNENGQMRREEYEAQAEEEEQEEQESSFGIQLASEDVIKRRKIVQARSRTKTQPMPSTGGGATGGNPFQGFQGLATPQQPSNPFAGFSGLTAVAPPKPKPTAPATAAPSLGTNTSSPSTYQEAITVLNKEFLAFVNEQLQKNPHSNWSITVQDYLRHAERIGTQFASTKPTAAREVTTNGVVPAKEVASVLPLAKEASSIKSGFSFGPAKTVSEPDKVTPAFSFGAASATTSSKEQSKPTSGFSFGATKTNAESEKVIPSFSFGSKPTAEATNSFSFNLSQPSTALPSSSSSGTGGFSFNLTASSSSSLNAAPVSATTATQGAEEEEDEENIGREDPTVILKSDNLEEQCVFEVEKAKIFEFKKKEQRWADKGTHPLQILVHKDTKNTRILVRNEIGKIVLNSALYKGLAVKAQETKGKKTGVITTLQIDGTMTQFLLKVTSTKVEEFICALKTATPKKVKEGPLG